MARFSAARWRDSCSALPGPVLEFGAGSGALAETLLKDLDREYSILETSRALRERQGQRLGNRVRWLERLPERFSGVMVANEVVDAMPVHALAWRARASWNAVSARI